MNDSDIIKICDLYSEGYTKFQELMQKDMWEVVPERTRMIECEMKKEYGGYEYKDKYSSYYALGGTCWRHCIPYEGNEHLLGTTKDCDNFYKT